MIPELRAPGLYDYEQHKTCLKPSPYAGYRVWIWPGGMGNDNIMSS